MKNDGHLKSDSCKHVARQAIQLCRVQQMAHYGQVWPQRIPSYEAILNVFNRHTIGIPYRFTNCFPSYSYFVKKAKQFPIITYPSPFSRPYCSNSDLCPDVLLSF
ncbi:unnamed protein product [Dracunculus medinensis]|uniref:HTH CENPB-type domain-containing protein n=1 Tax=Dracunculus medinensis TaxID=318479 RepID=A0A0N4UK46_DRAME|nr:unnamed protein product [Dracunculus medinensis]